MSAPTTAPSDHDQSKTFSQLVILGVLIGGLVILHRFSEGAAPDFDPTGLLALGFVILASYTIGGLVEGIKLPHITGYLIAGLVFGPSAAAFLDETVRIFGYELVPPLQKGVLNKNVIDQLSLLDTLAIALIAMTAGGELHLDALKKGIFAILNILGFQLLAVIGLVALYIIAISGAVPWFTMPGLGGIDIATAAFIGVTIGAISFATSPAATIAVITETKARGPMSNNVLSTVVLKDVVVVVLFSIAVAIVRSRLTGVATEGLAGYLAQHIIGSLILGGATGALVAAYLYYVKQELLIFIIGVVYLVTYIAQDPNIDFDPVIVFLMAGFTVANFSKQGHQLIESVERLSLPVYVVFFTLAGAKLHLDDLAKVFIFAVLLVVVRMVAIWLGVRTGARLGKADEATRSYGWMGFVSQAGVAITLAAIVGRELGEVGRVLETLIIGGVALNELLGPVMFKAALGLAGETTAAGAEGEDDEQHLSVRPPTMRPESDAEGAAQKLTAWPEQIGGQALWRLPLQVESEELTAQVRDLTADLQSVVREVSTGPLRDYKEDAEKYIRDLRREFLRHHRRLAVQSRTKDENSKDALGTMLRGAQSDLAAHWRGIVLGRSISVGKQSWSPQGTIETLDSIVEALPEVIRVPYEAISYEDQEEESLIQSLERTWLRVRRRWRSALGQSPPQRDVEFRSLARYHISYDAPIKLEGLAALFIEADRHLVARTRSMFDGIAAGYDDIAKAAGDTQADLEQQLLRLRSDVEEELALALDEVERIAADGTSRGARALTKGLNALKDDLPTFGTMDLPASKRRSSKRFSKRIRAMERLTQDLKHLRRASATQYSMLAMELELLGVEAKVKDAVEDQISRLENMVRRRAVAQAERVDDVLKEALAKFQEELDADHTGQELANALREVTEGASKVTGEAARVTAQLYSELSDETRMAPLLDKLAEACRGLTSRYHVVAGQRQTGEWRLPTGLPQMEIPFREAVLTYVESRVAPKLLATTKALAQRVQPLANHLQELERLIAFNVELATTELEIVHDQKIPDEMDSLLRELTTGQLERGEAQLAEIRESSANWPQEFAKEMRAAAMGNLQVLRQDLADGSFSRARLEAMRRAATVLQPGDVVGGISGRLTQLKEWVKSNLRSTLGERRFRWWRERLGRGGDAGSELTAEAFAAPSPSTELPLVYRRLFAADTMEAGDVLTGREASVQKAEAVLASEARGRLRSVALIGIDGVGKAAVANAIVRTRRWKNTRRISWEAPVTLEDVESVFQDAAESQLVVVDGLHWLLSMEAGGFEPLRRFVAGIIDEGGKRRWLTYADRLFWNFASTVAPLRDAFPETIVLEPLDAEALQAAVIARHRLSGYEHAFDRTDRVARFDTFFARGASRLRRPFDQYFQDLHEETGGLVRDALRLWLASIRDIQDGEVVRLGPVPPSAYATLKRLPEDVLVTLYQIARTGWMNARGQARLFRIDESTAQAQLSRLAHLGLLVEQDGRFRLAVHLRGALARIFEQRRWVQ